VPVHVIARSEVPRDAEWQSPSLYGADAVRPQLGACHARRTRDCFASHTMIPAATPGPTCLLRARLYKRSRFIAGCNFSNFHDSRGNMDGTMSAVLSASTRASTREAPAFISTFAASDMVVPVVATSSISNILFSRILIEPWTPKELRRFATLWALGSPT